MPLALRLERLESQAEAVAAAAAAGVYTGSLIANLLLTWETSGVDRLKIFVNSLESHL